MKTTYCYVDGSTFHNVRYSQKAVGGIGVFFGENDPRNVSEPFYLFPVTNNRCEIQAATKAIESFMRHKIQQGNKEKEILVINGDSMYVINLITKWIHTWKLRGWKKANGHDVENRDLIVQLDNTINLYKDFVEVKFEFVKAHRNKAPTDPIEYKRFIGNMMADKLAKQGTMIAVQAAAKKE